MKKKVKNAIILGITGAMLAVWCFAVCIIDSLAPLALCALIGSTAWLALFAWANDISIKNEEEE